MGLWMMENGRLQKETINNQLKTAN